MFSAAEAHLQRLIESTQLETPVDVGLVLRDEALDEDDFETGSELLSPSSFGEASEAAPATGEGKSARRGELDALRSENASLRRAALAAESRAAGEIQAYQATVEASQRRTREQLMALREAQQGMQAEIPALRERLAQSKAQFSQLRISRERYDELRALPDDRVSIVEFAQMRAFELVDAAASAPRPARAEATGGETVLALEAKLKEAESQLQQAQRQVSQAQEENRALRAASSTAAVASVAAATPVLPSQQMQAALDEAESRADKLRAALAEREAEGVRAAEQAAAAGRELAEAAQRAQLLALDKEYLATQVAALQERCSAHETKALKRDAALAEMKREKDSMYEKLLAATGEAADTYSARLDAELAKWQQQAALAQAAVETAHERQVAQLREARELAVAEVDKGHTRYTELKKAHDELLLRAAEQHASAEVELAQLRSELKLKAFEAERLSLASEQQLADSRRGELTADASREKLEVLKGEYYALQASSGERIAVLEAQLNAQKERIASYDRMESELDAAVMAGGAQPGGASSIVVPTSAQRRLDQCVRLSAELLSAQGRVDEVGRELRGAHAEAEKLRQQLEAAERRLQLVHSPQKYLVEQLRIAEEKADTAVDKQKSAARALAERDEALDYARQQHRLLQADLERLLQQRGNFEALRGTLSRLMAKENAPAAALPPATSLSMSQRTRTHAS